MAPPTIRWRKGELIGCGAFGRVYMGMNLDSGELLAVKQVHFVLFCFMRFYVFDCFVFVGMLLIVFAGLEFEFFYASCRLVWFCSSWFFVGWGLFEVFYFFMF